MLTRTSRDARLRELSCAPQLDERTDTRNGSIRCAAATATAAAYLCGEPRTVQLFNAAVTKLGLTRSDARVAKLSTAFHVGQAEDLCAGHICCLQDLVFEAFGSRGEGTYAHQFETMMTSAGFKQRSCSLSPRDAAHQLAPGEMFALNYRSSPSSWHAVMVYNDSRAGLVIVDSARGPGRCVVDGAEVARYLRASGGEVFSGSVFFE